MDKELSSIHYDKYLQLNKIFDAQKLRSAEFEKRRMMKCFLSSCIRFMNCGLKKLYRTRSPIFFFGSNAVYRVIGYRAFIGRYAFGR